MNAELHHKLIQPGETEAREKLMRIRPVSLAQAARISGITPADVALLLAYLEQRIRDHSSTP